eukprot:CAMPEP_0182526412 /NCGR_PEP_ID=MMETSP1323-20130603/3168_1 /TAXON_ID=236787 /ORGANISM="Florenciella parvula, Strain RCC1693" /LENGTH=70 /DNA_ID=CAMNT_0024735265 /DNA_START=348 /DNA_END=557 /DNA_ORIENTATION=+
MLNVPLGSVDQCAGSISAPHNPGGEADKVELEHVERREKDVDWARDAEAENLGGSTGTSDDEMEGDESLA